MSGRTSAESKVQRAVDYLRAFPDGLALSAISRAVDLPLGWLCSALQRRRDNVGDVVNVQRRWRVCERSGESPAATPASEPAPKTHSGSGVIAGPKLTPKFVELRGYLSGVQVRPGSMDLLNLPSRIGDNRVKR